MSLLASSAGNEATSIARWLPTGTTSLEIWDLIIDGRPLWDWQSGEAFPEALGKALIAIHNGSAISASKGAIRPASKGFEAVLFTGGRSQAIEIQQELSQTKFPVHFSSSPIFGACNEALKEWTNSLVIDVGQTQIKIAYNQVRTLVSRDHLLLPILSHSEEYDLSEQRNRFEDFICSSLSLFSSETPDTVLLALPCHISATLTLGGSSYVGMRRNSSLLTNLVMDGPFPNSQWKILNDAELAVPLVRSLPYRKILVVTLGFGTGACIWERTP